MRWIGPIALVSVMAVSVSPAVASAPRLTLVQRAPLVVAGRGFASGERVSVTVYASVTVRKAVRASRTGAFRLAFGNLPSLLSHCERPWIRAVGARGSVATLKLTLPACLPA